ncbi:MAG: type II toxin-antitoxin system VapC family toxin [Burkholderiales bacterium]
MPFVLDNSVVTGWYIPDQATPYTQSIAKRLETDRAIVPALWQLEFANVLKTACTRGKLSLDNAREIVVTIAALPIELDSGLAPSPRQLLELAMRYSLSSYDAAYLELALRHGIPIACQDAKLKEASLQAGVVVL